MNRTPISGARPTGKQAVAVFLSVLILLLLAGCAARRPAFRGRVIFALFDMSGSTGMAEIRRAYLKDFLRVVEALEPGDILIADVITDNPLAQSEFPIREELRPFSPANDNSLIFNRRTEETRQRIRTGAQALLGTADRRSPASCVIDATRLAERVFATYNRHRPILLLFSDMVEECQGIDFRRRPPTERSAGMLLTRVEKEGRLPDLRGSRIYVVGALRDTAGGVPSSRQRGILSFWQGFFVRAKADFDPTRWGAALLAFEPEG